MWILNIEVRVAEINIIEVSFMHIVHMWNHPSMVRFFKGFLPGWYSPPWVQTLSHCRYAQFAFLKSPSL